MRRKIGLLVVLICVGCGSSAPSGSTPAGPLDATSDATGTADLSQSNDLSAAAGITPVYVTVVGHIEDVKNYANCGVYQQKRAALLTFVQTLAGYGVAFNLQVSYEWLIGTRDCESNTLKATTGGKNLLDYLAEQYGVEIDAHKEGAYENHNEMADNYADVRYLGGQLTTAISETVGGIQWDNAEQWQRLNDGWAGWITPSFVWRPELLTLGVGSAHHTGNFGDDDLSSGIWIPQGGGAQFFNHDATGRMVYIGPGHQHANWGGGTCQFPFDSSVAYVKALATMLSQGSLPGGKIYTASLAIPQSRMLDTASHASVTAQLDALKPLLDDGRAVSLTYAAIVNLWRSKYNAQANIVAIGQIDKTLWDCPSWTP